ncbi:hypothetical protein P7H60_11335 [Vagococcus carniphilus]|uniref:hypothetical protein n=1 Tax=Vagococcus carniphilus TaxID=218144 RepID=UPI002890090A|nr:hypothetical protein [Vagococcus carniphilus]MDT2849734.1 hypothetical protein [Vagococcus carniphilus]
MKKKYSSKLNQIENKLNYKESDDFVRHIYHLLAIQDLSDQELDELIELGNKDLEAMSLKHDELIKVKMNEVKFGEIDQEFIEKERKIFK